VGRYVSEALFGRQLAQHPPAHRRARFGPGQPSAGQATFLRQVRPEPVPHARPEPVPHARPEPVPHARPEPVPHARPELTRPAGMALIITGTVLLLAVSIPIPFLSVKLLGLILIVAGLIKVRALQRASRWLWRNRREVMTALDAPSGETAAPRVPLDTLLDQAD
jgi:hypothetical protein